MIAKRFLGASALGLVLATGTAVALVGCGGSGHGSPVTAATTAPGSVSLTDAASDLLSSFEVRVTAIDLKRVDGALVHTLPAATRIDFAELVNEAQLLTTFSGLAGAYRSCQITMDFSPGSSPNVVIAGQTTPASVTDASGNPLNGSVTEEIRFNNGNPFVIVPGTRADLSLDLNLDASCSIDTSTNTVKLNSTIDARQVATPQKRTNVYGQLASVDSAASSFAVTLNRPGALQAGPSVAVSTGSSTLFFVDGQASTFSAFAARPIGNPGTAVLCQGNFSGLASFAATAVEAWTPRDVVEGHVLSRDAAGNLTVIGRGENLATGAISLNTTFTVNATSTKVFPRPIPGLSPSGALTNAAIGVGQRVIARGALTGASLDCTSGHVALLETGIFGYGSSVAGNALTMNVARIGRRPVSAFNFVVGTQTTATPSAYVVNVGTLGLAGIVSGTPVAARAIVAPWASSTPGGTGPDATAVTVVDRSNVASLLFADWLNGGTATPFTSASATGLTLGLTGTLARFIDQGFVSPVRYLATDRPSIVPLRASGLYVLRQHGEATIYGDFASFQADLASRMASAKVDAISAIGRYDAATLTLSASVVVVHLR